jgi:hypothetical protein
MYVVRFGGPSPHALHFGRPHLLGRGAIPQGLGGYSDGRRRYGDELALRPAGDGRWGLRRQEIERGRAVCKWGGLIPTLLRLSGLVPSVRGIRECSFSAIFLPLCPVKSGSNRNEEPSTAPGSVARERMPLLPDRKRKLRGTQPSPLSSCPSHLQVARRRNCNPTSASTKSTRRGHPRLCTRCRERRCFRRKGSATARAGRAVSRQRRSPFLPQLAEKSAASLS